MDCLFASDLHGDPDRYRLLLQAVRRRRPEALFLGGDLLPHAGFGWSGDEGFLLGELAPALEALRRDLGDSYPAIVVILGNDDPRATEEEVLEIERRGLWTYAHDRRVSLRGYDVFGYAFVPPTPFQLKDWERYDVSRYVDPGCVSPEEGRRTVPVPEREIRHATIQQDLSRLTSGHDLTRAVLLCHSPPYKTHLDRAALDGKKIDHVPLDVHVGSIAVRRFIERQQPLVSLHGHVHESARLTGDWREQLGRTWMFGGAHDGPELALIVFRLEELGAARRELLGI